MSVSAILINIIMGIIRITKEYGRRNPFSGGIVKGVYKRTLVI